MKLPCCRRLPAGVADAEQACQRRVRCVWRPCRTGLLSILPERISGETEGNEAMSLEQVTNADQPLTDDEAMLVRVQREDFSIDEELRRVRARSKRIGGIAIFLGTARDRSKGKDVDGITFEHYEGMAQKKLRDIRERASPPGACWAATARWNSKAKGLPCCAPTLPRRPPSTC